MATHSDNFKLIMSSRCGQKLNVGGFLFDKQRICGDVTHWQCEKKCVCAKQGCTGYDNSEKNKRAPPRARYGSSLLSRN